MACIVAGILSLLQYKNSLKTNSEMYHVRTCLHPNCGKEGLHRHGFRYRKSIRENDDKPIQNPIPILRMDCPTCKRTCSVLPECIPPFRWYLWAIQQIAMEFWFSGMSYNKISQTISPSRWITVTQVVFLGDLMAQLLQ